MSSEHLHHDSEYYDHSSQDTPYSYYGDYPNGEDIGYTHYYSHEKHVSHISTFREDPHMYSHDTTPGEYDVSPEYLDNPRYTYGRRRYYAHHSTRSAMNASDSYPDSNPHHYRDPYPIPYPSPYPSSNSIQASAFESATQQWGPNVNHDPYVGKGVYPAPPYGRRRSRTHDGNRYVPPINTAPQDSYLDPSQDRQPPRLRSAGAVPAASENFEGDGGPGLSVPQNRQASDIRRSKSLTKPLSSIAKGAMSGPKRGLSKLKSEFRGRTLTRHGFRDKSRSRSGSGGKD